jgi:hypothetical protein
MALLVYLERFQPEAACN